jgi:hypothetical protein
MIFFDLKFVHNSFARSPTASLWDLTVMNEGRTVFAQLIDQTAQVRIGQVYCSLQRQPPHALLFHLRTVSDHGFCTTHLPRKSARHRHLSPRCRPQTLPQWSAASGRSQHLGRRQRKERLAHFRRLYSGVIQQALTLYSDEPFGIVLNKEAYALDSTPPSICAFRSSHRSSSAVTRPLSNCTHAQPAKQFSHCNHCLYRQSSRRQHSRSTQLRGRIVLLFARAYLDFVRLHRLHAQRAFFVSRAKQNLKCRPRYSCPVDKSMGLRCEQTIILTGFYSRRDYPEVLRQISFRDEETKKVYVFLTNNFSEPALKIAQLYRWRWNIELFFKWIKQHLRIKAFYGTSENAVRVQVWIANTVYLLVVIFKKRHRCPPPQPLHNSTGFERVAFREKPHFTNVPATPPTSIITLIYRGLNRTLVISIKSK